MSHDGYARLADLLLAGMERIGFVALVEETLSGGWMRMLVLEREPRSRVSPEGTTTT